MADWACMVAVQVGGGGGGGGRRRAQWVCVINLEGG